MIDNNIQTHMCPRIHINLYDNLIQTHIFPVILNMNYPYELVHHFNVQNHSLSPHPMERAWDEKQDEAEEEVCVPDEASVGPLQLDQLELSLCGIIATNYHPELRLISKFSLP